MKEIKFRAWDKDNKKFFYIEIKNNQLNFKTYPLQEGTFLNPNIDGDWQEYIGLKDKNGTEIYKGDIIGSTGHTGKVENSIIEFGKFGNNLDYYRKGINNGDIYNDWGMSWHYEVIGNIYENPELLK